MPHPETPKTGSYREVPGDLVRVEADFRELLQSPRAREIMMSPRDQELLTSAVCRQSRALEADGDGVDYSRRRAAYVCLAGIAGFLALLAVLAVLALTCLRSGAIRFNGNDTTLLLGHLGDACSVSASQAVVSDGNIVLRTSLDYTLIVKGKDDSDQLRKFKGDKNERIVRTQDRLIPNGTSIRDLPSSFRQREFGSLLLAICNHDLECMQTSEGDLWGSCLPRGHSGAAPAPTAESGSSLAPAPPLTSATASAIAKAVQEVIETDARANIAALQARHGELSATSPSTPSLDDFNNAALQALRGEVSTTNSSTPSLDDDVALQASRGEVSTAPLLTFDSASAIAKIAQDFLDNDTKTNSAALQARPGEVSAASASRS
ncbi:unnamed protein product [Polarella glacialis]|uniref:Uncharacterized protein n=1 Tax=Polarella glacialis TaxID=89957 RepID=A0A813HVE2_POLGL|nr:unnamed protein product [Polarella glacialis]